MLTSFVSNIIPPSGLHTLLWLLDVIIVAFFIYRGLLVIRGTRAAPMLLGLSALVFLYLISKPLELYTLSFLLGNFLSSIILVVVVIFQDEIRRALTTVGMQRLVPRKDAPSDEKVVDEISMAVRAIAKEKLGALIVIQRKVGLDEFMNDAVLLDARIHKKTLYTIFVKSSPLHDGAVVIDADRIKAAGCVLPLSFNPDLDPNLGTRHRAALGISERSDALVIVVSEENGSVSIAEEGHLTRNFETEQFKEYVLHAIRNPSKRLPAAQHSAKLGVSHE